jgi:hypothetical protein
VIDRGGDGGRRRLLAVVMIAVGVWGVVMAVGALLFGYDTASGEIRFSPNPLRGGIVLTCVLAFLGGWTWLVRRRFR